MGSHTTTNTTQSSNQAYQNTYNPTSLAAYNSSVATSMPILEGYANSPFSNPFFQTQVAMGNKNAAQIGGQAMNSLQSNMQAQGISGNSAAAASMTQRQGFLNSSLRANSFLNAVNSAQLNQWNALGLLQNFRPLQTGGTAQSSGQSSTTQSTGGLGTWLPQVIGAGVGLASTAATGGFGSGAQGLFNGGGGGSSAASAAPFMGSLNMSSLSNPFGGASNSQAASNPFGGSFNMSGMSSPFPQPTYTP